MKYLYHPTEGAKLFEEDENPDGWFDTPAAFDEKEPTREELLALAAELGVTVDKRWGIDRLKEALRGDRP